VALLGVPESRVWAVFQRAIPVKPKTMVHMGKGMISLLPDLAGIKSLCHPKAGNIRPNSSANNLSQI
jgi:hypothetical protein